jgi:glycosyltransferase involved in cell wall biosynthesis
MRILVATHGYPPTRTDGAERRAERTARALLARGHDVSVLAVERVDSPNERRETADQDGLTVHRLFYDVSAGDRARNLYDHQFVGRACREVLRTHPVDVVHVISGYLLGGQVVDAARECQARVVITLTEFWFLCARLNLLHESGEICAGPGDEKCARCLLEEKRRFRLPARYAPRAAQTVWQAVRHLPSAQHAVAAVARRRKVLQAALESADLVISPSRFMLEYFARAGFDTSAFRFMRQGVARSPAPPPSPPAESQTLRLGFAGQLKAHKGLDLLIAAVARLIAEGRPVTLDIWGAESDAPAYTRPLRQRTADIAAIRWNGRADGARLSQAFASLDALVVPSRWFENSPNVILEAFAAGLAVIATDLGGMAELVESGVNGQLFALNDIEDLCEQLRRLASDRGLLARLRAHTPAVPTLDDEMADVVRAYEGLLQTRPEPA